MTKTQEKRNTFLTSVPVPMLIMYRENDEQSEDKNDSEMCHLSLSEQAETIVKELNSMHGEAKKKIEELIQQLRQDKLKDHEIKQVLFSRVNFVSKRTLYRALPEDLKREYTKPLPKTINISTPHKVIEPVEEYIGSPEPEEDPKDLEIQFLKEKEAELEDALKQTEQFKPATALQTASPISNPDEHYFKFLTDRADGVSSFYYDRYGIDLFKNRILSQLKNSGVTTFKRLYFEV